MIVRCLLTALFLGWTAAAHAIVNIESLRAIEPTQGYSGSLDVAVNGQSGNTDKFGTNAGGRLQWHGGAVTNFAILRYAYAQSSGVEDTNKLLFHARHIHQLTGHTAYEAFIQASRDKFTRLSFRGLIGGGARFTLFKKPDVRVLHLGLGAFYVRETLESAAGVTDNGSQNYWRINTYVNYLHHINDQVSILTTTYYQPATGNPGDFRVLEEATLSVKMSNNLSLNVSLDVAHDSKPPQKVKRTDTIYSTGIEYSF